MAANGRVCAVCNQPYTGVAHTHAQMGMPKAVQNMGPVSTPRPMVGTPPTKKKRG